MGLHKEYEEPTFSDFNLDEEHDDIPHRKQIKRRLEERLERKRLKEEFQDDFDEFTADFDWDELDK